jgi:hypothetical protein
LAWKSFGNSSLQGQEWWDEDEDDEEEEEEMTLCPWALSRQTCH